MFIILSRINYQNKINFIYKKTKYNKINYLPLKFDYLKSRTNAESTIKSCYEFVTRSKHGLKHIAHVEFKIEKATAHINKRVRNWKPV